MIVSSLSNGATEERRHTGSERAVMAQMTSRRTDRIANAVTGGLALLIVVALLRLVGVTPEGGSTDIAEPANPRAHPPAPEVMQADGQAAFGDS